MLGSLDSLLELLPYRTESVPQVGSGPRSLSFFMRDEARPVHMRKKPVEVGVGVDLALSCLGGVRMGDGAKRGNPTR